MKSRRKKTPFSLAKRYRFTPQELARPVPSNWFKHAKKTPEDFFRVCALLSQQTREVRLAQRQRVAAIRNRRYLKMWLGGYIAIWNTPSDRGGRYQNFIISPGAFSQCLASGRRVIMGVDHENEFGSTSEGNLRLWQDDRGLAFTFFPRDDPPGRELVELVRQGRLRGCSFRYTGTGGFRPGPNRHYSETKTAEILDIEEVTLTSDPAFPQTGRHLALYQASPLNGLQQRWDRVSKQWLAPGEHLDPARAGIDPRLRLHFNIN